MCLWYRKYKECVGAKSEKSRLVFFFKYPLNDKNPFFLWIERYPTKYLQQVDQKRAFYQTNKYKLKPN